MDGAEPRPDRKAVSRHGVDDIGGCERAGKAEQVLLNERNVAELDAVVREFPDRRLRR